MKELHDGSCSTDCTGLSPNSGSLLYTHHLGTSKQRITAAHRYRKVIPATDAAACQVICFVVWGSGGVFRVQA